MKGVRKNPDYPVIANLVKIIVLTSEQKMLLHKEGFERTEKLMIENLLQQIFEV